MKRSIALILFAFASPLLAVADPCGNACSTPSPGGFTFQRTYEMFDAGLRPSPEQLVGRWRLVGEVNWQGLNYAGSDFFDLGGWQNQDGSRITYEFAPGVRFDGTTELTVSLQNIGGAMGASQGPYETCFGSTTVYFSQWPYPQYDNVGRFEHECRLVKKDAKKMICAFVPKEIKDSPHNGLIVALEALVLEE